MVSLALDGSATFRDRYELIHRHRAETPNAIWQADHTMLDILILDEASKPVRPWLTITLDDHSRAVAGTLAFIGAPSVLNTCLALRHAIWRKADPAWPVCGVRDMLYVDHGSDFTAIISTRLRRLCTFKSCIPPSAGRRDAARWSACSAQ
jgi:putative transposase